MKEKEDRDEKKKGQQEVQTLTNSYLMIDPNKCNGVLPRLYNYTDYNAFSRPTEDVDMSTGSITQSVGSIPSPIVGKYIHLPDGSVSLPALAWASETNSGLYKISSNNFGQSVNGTLVYDWSSSRLFFASAYNVCIGRDSATAAYVNIYNSVSSTKRLVDIVNSDTYQAGEAFYSQVTQRAEDETLGITFFDTYSGYANPFTTSAADGFNGDALNADTSGMISTWDIERGGLSISGFASASPQGAFYSPAVSIEANWGANRSSGASSDRSAIRMNACTVSGSSAAAIANAAYVLEVLNNGTGLLMLTGAGNLGLGTHDPASTSKLHMHNGSGSNLNMRFTNSSSGTSTTDGFSIGIDSSPNAFAWVYEAYAFYFGTNNTERMRILSGGGIVMGATPTALVGSETLRVKGGIVSDSLTATRVTFAGTAGLLTDDAGLTYVAASDALTVSGFLKVGTATDAAAAGDFSAGLTGAARMFYDQSVPTLTFYNSSGTVVNLISSVASTATVWNEQGADIDFRIEGDTDANLFFLDASTDFVGIGTSGPDRKLDVLSTSTQLRLTYTDGSVYADFGVNSSGNVEINPTGTDLVFAKSSAGNNVRFVCTNTDNTNASSHASFSIQTGGTSAGDPYISFVEVEAFRQWSIGFDNSDSDKFKICVAGNLTAGDAFYIETGGKAWFGAELEIDGALNHDGTTVGFYGVAPTARSSAYTPTNVTTDRSFDADTVAITELADVVGTLIADLQATGLIG